MDPEIHENCGVAAVYLKKDPSTYPEGGTYFFLQKMLQQLQHRGQLSAGITTYQKNRNLPLKTHKGNGLVSEIFAYSDARKASRLAREFGGSMGIGHTRYATAGSDEVEEAQPFERVHSRTWKWFAFGFNGNMANARPLREDLWKMNYHFRTSTDTEVMMHLIAHHLGNQEPIPLRETFSRVEKEMDGAYNIVFINAQGEMIIARDPQGFKPLCYVDTPDFFLAASESAALLPFAKNGIQHLKPGHLIQVSEKGVEVHAFAPPAKKISHCMFEWVYFASAGSVMENHSVYETRWNLGVELAREEKHVVNPHEWVVVNVPDTSKPAADGYAYTMGLPSKEGLLRNRYVGRTFIEGGKWQDKIREKFIINKPALTGKHVLLVEDSIVRGNTLKEIAKRLREEGDALSVHARISCPPILNPCFYGIDMSTFSQLLAARKQVKEWNENPNPLSEEEVSALGKELGVDSLRYQTWPGLKRAFNALNDKLCMACLDGKYPTAWGQTLANDSWKRFQEKKDGRANDE